MNFSPSRRACEVLLWFILFFSVAAFGATEWWSRDILEALIVVLGGLCFLRREPFPRLPVPLLGFLAIIALAAVQAANARSLSGPASLLPFTADRAETVRAAAWWSSMSVLFWASSRIAVWEGALRRAALVVFAIGLFIAFVGILQRGQGNTAYYGLRPIVHGRPFGPFTNYDHAANWMVGSTLVGSGLFFERLLARRSIPLSDLLPQLILILFILGVSVGGILETGSRGAFNAFVLAAIVSVFFAADALPGSRAPLLARLAVLLIACAYARFLYLNPRWLGLAGGSLDESASYRMSMYRSGMRLFADFPIFGVGAGGFARAFLPYQERMVVGFVDHVHCSWLEVALEFGLTGALALMVIFSGVASLFLRLTRSEVRASALSTGVLGAALALLLHGFVEFTFQIPANAVLLCVLLAAASAITVASSELAVGRQRKSPL